MLKFWGGSPFPLIIILAIIGIGLVFVSSPSVAYTSPNASSFSPSNSETVDQDSGGENEDSVVERACPFNTQEGRIVVEFPKDAVLTTRSQSANSFGPLDVDIPAGDYRVTLVSFDDHIEQPQEEDQKQESWFLQARNAEGDIVFESNPINDLAQTQNILVEQVAESAQISQDITGLSAKHLLDVGESETAESISPVCAAFDIAPPPSPSNDDFDNATVISELPFSDSINTTEATAGDDDPDPECPGASGGTTVWYAFTPEEDARIEADTFRSDYNTILAAYTGSRGNLTEIACSDDVDRGDEQSRVVVDAVAGETYFFMIRGGGQLVFSVGIAPPPPSNDDFDNATVVSDLPFSDSIDTTGATTASDDPDLCGQGHTVWYVFTPEEDIEVQAATGGNYDTVLSVYTGSRGDLTLIACNDDTDDLQSFVEFDAVAGETYFFMIAAFGSDAGHDLSFSVDIFTGEFPFSDSIERRTNK